jgi:hypothetical protein
MTAFHRDRLPLVGVLAFGFLDLLYLRSLQNASFNLQVRSRDLRLGSFFSFASRLDS